MRLFLALAMLMGEVAHAQMLVPIPFDTSAQQAYVGPGDVVSGAQFWGGLRAYSAATRGTNAAKVRRPDASSQDIVTLNDGSFDIASAITFAGTGATCSGTIASTTLTVASCSVGTLAVNQTISSTSIVGPSYITVIGTCAAPPGTCTLNAAQTVSVAETITAVPPLTTLTIYDQSGANLCSSAPCNATSSLGAGAFVIRNCVNNLQPCLLVQAAAVPSIASAAYTGQPMTISAVVKRFQNLTTRIYWWGVNGVDIAAGYRNATNTAEMRAPTLASAGTLNDSVWHAVQSVFNGASGINNIDGTQTTSINTGTNNTGTHAMYYGGNSSGLNMVNGYIGEVGYWPSALSTGDQNSLCHNQYTYWSTTTSC